MRRHELTGLLMVLLLSSWAVGDDLDSPFKTTPPKVFTTPDLSAESGVLDPGKQLAAARSYFVQVDFGAAASRIRQAAKGLRAAANDAGIDAKKSLSDAAEDLDNLGRRVEQRAVKSVEELDKPFAKAYHALAGFHLSRGQHHWTLRQAQPTGHRLRAATDNLEHAATAAGQKLGAAEQKVADQSRHVSAKLVEGAGVAASDVGKAFDSVGRQIDAVGKSIEPGVARQPTDRSTK